MRSNGTQVLQKILWFRKFCKKNMPSLKGLTRLGSRTEWHNCLWNPSWYHTHFVCKVEYCVTMLGKGRKNVTTSIAFWCCCLLFCNENPFWKKSGLQEQDTPLECEAGPLINSWILQFCQKKKWQTLCALGWNLIAQCTLHGHLTAKLPRKCNMIHIRGDVGLNIWICRHFFFCSW